MQNAERDFLVSRIIGGLTPLRIGPDRFWKRTPTAFELLRSNEIYFEVFEEAGNEGVRTQGEILEWMYKDGLWTVKEEDELKTVTKDIDTLRIKIFQSVYNTRERDAARALLKRARDHQSNLFHKKHSFDHVSQEGLATAAKHGYLVGCTLLQADAQTPVWNNESFLKDQSALLSSAQQADANNRLSESQFRELARTNPWRSFWNGRELCSPFKMSPLGDEQQNLIYWTKLYDNTYESPDCPPDDVIEDDDGFDGWCLLRRRERDKMINEKRAEALIGNEKIANSGEVFIMAQSPEDIAKIEDLNNPQAAAIKKRRLDYVSKQGDTPEALMPDTRENLVMQFNRMLTQKAKGQ